MRPDKTVGSKGMRVLLALEEEYRIYTEAMEAAIRAFRPQVELQVAAPALLMPSWPPL